MLIGKCVSVTNLRLVNQEGHRFQDGGEDEEREDNQEQQPNIFIGIIFFWYRPDGITKQVMSLEYFASLNMYYL